MRKNGQNLRQNCAFSTGYGRFSRKKFFINLLPPRPQAARDRPVVGAATQVRADVSMERPHFLISEKWMIALFFWKGKQMSALP